MNLPRPLPDDEVIKLAKDCLTFREVILKNHAKERMDERSFNIQDIIHVIKNGKISRKPVWNEKHQNYRYYIKGEDFNGSELEVVIAFNDKNQIIIISGLG